MLGGTLALLQHSLQLDGRLFRHHLYRLIFVGVLYLFVVIATGQSLLLGAPGQWMFGWIAYLNFWFISLAGISYFATAISEEKESESLGILRMAGISPSALLLGKSTSRMIVACLLLSLQFPFALLAITLGGVTTLQVFSVFLALLAYTAFVANLALFCSVIARRASSASVMMTVALGLFFFVPLFVRMIAGSVGSTAVGFVRAVETVLAPQYETSVFARLPEIMATGFDESPVSFQVLSNLAAAFVFFVFSRLVFDRVTRYHSVASVSRGVLLRPTGKLKILGPRRAWKSALIWKDFHFVTGGKPLLLLKSLVYGLVLVFACVIAFIEGSSNPFILIALWSIWPVGLLLLIESTVMASRVFREEVQLNALPSLMLLPIRPARIAYAKVAGCLVALAPGLIALTLGVASVAIAILIESDSQAAASSLVGLIFAGVGVVVGLTFVLFFVHLVAYLSLVVKWGSIPMSIGISLVLVLFLCFMWPIAVFVFLGGAVGLHFMIGSRFKQLGMQ